MSRCSGLLLALCIAIGCNGNNQVAPPGADGGNTVNPPPATSDPLICVGDPDTGIVCKKQSEFWDCTQMPNGDVKCNFKQPLTPDGTTGWTCTASGGKIVCKSSTPNLPGGAGWTCTSSEQGTTCEKSAPTPPGGTDWNCSYSGEFTYGCQGKTVAPPTTPPPTTAPNGGIDLCFQPAPGTTVTLPKAPPEGWWAKLIAKRVLYNGIDAAYVKLIISKAFVDNTYGNYAVEWQGPGKIGGGHSFNDLVESDKNEFFFEDTKGNLLLQVALDYISQSTTAKSGYACLGVTGGEGFITKGTAADVLAAQTSLSMNFNGYGYVLTQDSPVTDVNYKPDPKYPNWIFEVWYEAWVKWSAFGAAGPGKIYITGLHASPNKLGHGVKPPTLVGQPCP